MDNYVTICFLIALFLILLIIASLIIVRQIERLEDAFDKLDDKIIKLEAMMDYVMMMMKDEVDEHND